MLRWGRYAAVAALMAAFIPATSEEEAEVKKPARKAPFKRRRRTASGSSSKKKKKEVDIDQVVREILLPATDDVLTFSLQKVAVDRVQVREVIDTGLLRFGGRVIGKQVLIELP